ncbi:MAG: DUF421 domain-containing protein [Ruminococcaceae bacterium]|nr:DUF421 domain-containing protein [Oscillospiraceae bacterium]
MAISFVRTIILYILVVFALRVMGKRQIGELQPSELVVAIMISDLATTPVSDINIPLLAGVIPILTLLVFEVVTSFANLKSEGFRNFLSGKPTVVIKNGVISQLELKKLRFSIEDLLEQLRLKGIFSISDVYMAILETNGELTVVEKSSKKPVTAEDLNLTVKQERIPLVIISDGKLRKEHLKESGFDEKWVMDTIKEYNIEKIEDVFIFSIDDDDKYTLQIKSKM